MNNRMSFLNDQADFRIRRPEEISYLYFPLASEVGLKSSVTPLLGGDAKITQNSFLLSPTSSENLHNDRSTRNFWIRIQDQADEMKVWSLTGAFAKQEAERFTKEHREKYCIVYAYDYNMNDDATVDAIRAYAAQRGLKTYSIGYFHR